MAILKSSKNKEETAKFADFLKGKEAAKIFEKYGFQPIKK
jgi:molybdate transport system substrate-binding protein